MTTAVIADDEPLLRDELRDALEELWPELNIVAECADGVTALNEVERHKPDIAFLDIKMPRMTGLEAAEQISGNTMLVFVTAFDDHAIPLNAYRQDAATPQATARRSHAKQRGHEARCASPQSGKQRKSGLSEVHPSQCWQASTIYHGRRNCLPPKR